MKTTERYTIIALSLLSFVFIYAKCQKDIPLPPCSGDCNDVFFSGNVLNAAYNTPIRNAQIQVTTPGDFLGPVDTIYIVGTVLTDANGNFSILKNIDTTTHTMYTIKATMPPGYLVSPETSDQYSTYVDNTEKEYFYAIDSGIRQIQFEAFPVTRLQINLHRSSALPDNNSYNEMNLDYSVDNADFDLIGSAYSGFIETLKNTDTVIYLETSPVLHTIIQWSRGTGSGTFVSGTDSISCQPNTTNQISITY